MKVHYLLSISLVILLLTSCGSKKKQQVPESRQPVTVTRKTPTRKPAPKKQESVARQEKRQELSRVFGLNIAKDDNLRLYIEAEAWLGTPHRMGGNTMNGVDCSGFVVNIYKDVYRKQLYRSSADILEHNCRWIDRAGLQEGDLVFFRTGGGNKKVPNHVGIYLKNGKFVHTSSSRGVMVSSLSEPYFMRSWITGGRVK